MTTIAAPTKRMLKIAKRWAEGYTDDEVAGTFGISARYVKKCREEVRDRLGVKPSRGPRARADLTRAIERFEKRR
jgi:DNA-binding NarL/FixJ family response regulator